MKNNILKYFTLILSVLVILIVYLSIVGIETDKFNNQIKKRISLTNKNIDIDLKKIKLTLDPFKLKIFAKTVGTTVYFAKRPLALESIKTQVSLSSLIKNKISSVLISDDKPGSLLQSLNIFSELDINLTKLESRPILGRPWEYKFYIDYELENLEKQSELEEKISKVSKEFKLLGHYPKAIQ